MSHGYCRGMLKGIRFEAKEKGIKIPATSSSKLFEDHYAVFLGDDWYSKHGACCAFYARWEAIHEYMGEKC